MKRPMLMLLAALLTGMSASYFMAHGIVSHSVISGIAISLIIFGIIAGLALLAYISRYPLWHYRNLADRVWIFAIFAGIGMMAFLKSIPESIHSGGTIEVTGTGRVIASTLKSNGNHLIVDVKSLSTNADEPKTYNNLKLQIVSADPHASFRNGDIISFNSKVTPTEDMHNPALQWWREALERKGIAGYGRSPVDGIVVIGNSQTIFDRISDLNTRLCIYLDHRISHHRTKALVKSLLLGNREDLTEFDRAKMADAGISHILALSGLHVGLLMFALSFILSPLDLIAPHWVRRSLIILILIGYALLCGMGASVVRATLMAIIYTIGTGISRRADLLNTLCGALFLILLADPMSMLDIGLQLSAAAMLLVCIFPLENPLPEYPLPSGTRFGFAQLGKNMGQQVLFALWLGVGMWCLSGAIFHRIPLMFLPTNLAVLPFLPIYIGIAALWLLSAVVGIEIHIFLDILNFMSDMLHRLAEIASQYVIDATLPPYLLPLWALLILLLLRLRLHRLDSSHSP